jgi:hypothetical protein
MTEKLIQALKSLIIDIESMQDKELTEYFGPFSESFENDDGNTVIDWPNLAISLDDLKQALLEVEATHRHVKRGTLYRVLGKAELQTARSAHVLGEGATLIVYQGEDGKLWLRDEGEFNDGRFEKLP